jgi:hypothetical protein
MFALTRGPCQARQGFQRLVELSIRARREVSGGTTPPSIVPVASSEVLICSSVGRVHKISAGGQVAVEMVTGIFDRGTRAYPSSQGEAGHRES